jgi:hypothetical protein
LQPNIIVAYAHGDMVPFAKASPIRPRVKPQFPLSFQMKPPFSPFAFLVPLALIVFGVLGFLFWVHLSSGSVPSGWLTYHSETFPLSFRYPPNYYVDQNTPENLRVVSDYHNAQIPVAEVALDIEQQNAQHLTPNTLGLTTPFTVSTTPQGYDLVYSTEPDGPFILLLTDDGTFLMTTFYGPPLDLQSQLPVAVYTSYQNIFNEIVSTIRVN